MHNTAYVRDHVNVNDYVKSHASHDSFPPQEFLYTPSIWPDTQHTDILPVSRARATKGQSPNTLPNI